MRRCKYVDEKVWRSFFSMRVARHLLDKPVREFITGVVLSRLFNDIHPEDAFLLLCWGSKVLLVSRSSLESLINVYKPTQCLAKHGAASFPR